MTTKTELACVYSALILVDDDIAVTVRKFHVSCYSCRFVSCISIVIYNSLNSVLFFVLFYPYNYVAFLFSFLITSYTESAKVISNMENKTICKLNYYYTLCESIVYIAG